MHLYRGKIYLSQNLTNRLEPVQDLADPPIEPERVQIYLTEFTQGAVLLATVIPNPVVFPQQAHLTQKLPSHKVPPPLFPQQRRLQLKFAMGRGKSWDTAENEALARAWLVSSEDPVVGVNQTSKIFMDTLRRRFIERGPTKEEVPAGRFGNRTAASIKQNFSDVSADVQKFGVALMRVRASNPTGVGEEGVLFMAVAIQTGRTNVMEYDYKDLYKDEWMYYRAWTVLRNHPKWAPVDSNTHAASTAVGEAIEEPTVSAPEAQHIHSDDTTPHKRTQRFGLGTRGAKMAKQEEIRTMAVHSLAHSAKRKIESLEERNAIPVFSRPEAQGLTETTEFFADLSKTYLAQALNRARAMHEDSDEPAASVLASQIATQNSSSPTSTEDVDIVPANLSPSVQSKPPESTSESP